METKKIKKAMDLLNPTEEQKERLKKQIELSGKSIKSARRIRKIRSVASVAAAAAIVVIFSVGINAASGGAVMERIRQVFTIDQGRQDVAGQAERVSTRGVEVYAPDLIQVDDESLIFATKRGVLVYDRTADALKGTIDLQKIGCIYIGGDPKATHILKQGEELVIFNSEDGKAEKTSWHFDMDSQDQTAWSGKKEEDQKASDRYLKAWTEAQGQYTDTFDLAETKMGGLGTKRTDQNAGDFMYSERSLSWTDGKGAEQISYLTVDEDGSYTLNTWSAAQKKTVARTLDLTDRGAENAKTAALPEFSYMGDDPAIEALLTYQKAENEKLYDMEGGIWIPTPVIYERVEENDEVILFGNFGDDVYKLNGTILESTSGSRVPGCAHIRKKGDTWEVTKLIYAEDGSDFDDSIRKFTEGYPGAYKAFQKDHTKEEQKTRLEYLRMYVKGNRLNITHYQDYGWDPVEIK